MITADIVPNTTVIRIPIQRVCRARSCFPAPAFCAESTETADSMQDGTKNKMPIIFSTMPTAAALFNPLLFAIIVIIRNEI